MPESEKKKKPEKKKKNSALEAERRRAQEDAAATRIQAQFRRRAAGERVEDIREAKLADMLNSKTIRAERDRVWREQLTELYMPGFVHHIAPTITSLPSARKVVETELTGMTKLELLKSGKPDLYKETWKGWPSDKDIVGEILAEEYKRRVQKELTSRYPLRKSFGSLSKATPIQTKAKVSTALNTGSVATGGTVHLHHRTASTSQGSTPQMSPVSADEDDNAAAGESCAPSGPALVSSSAACLGVEATPGPPGETNLAPPSAAMTTLDDAAAVEC